MRGDLWSRFRPRLIDGVVEVDYDEVVVAGIVAAAAR